MMMAHLKYRRIKMNLSGSKTEQSLKDAFAGESQARNRYTMFSKIAKKEGYEQISEMFLETAGNEFEHAKIFFRHLEGGAVEITATYPAGIEGTTPENLAASAAGEHEEWEELYPEFARIADEEGFPKVAASFRMIAKIEKEHEERYQKFFKAALKKFGVTSPGELEGEKKKEFFDYVDKNYEADNESD